ncbi:MAG: hypothetical protein RBS13_08280 [Bacteroidales bacterium]|jgi:hypothetical protein|nr:hypothetical protein [Bacteroidales bacterium]
MILKTIKKFILNPIKIIIILAFLLLILIAINIYGILGLNIDNSFGEIANEIFDIPIQNNTIELTDSQKQIQLNLYNEKFFPVLLPSFQINLLMEDKPIIKTRTPITFIPSKKQKTINLELTTNYQNIQNLNSKKQIQISILGIKVAQF